MVATAGLPSLRPRDRRGRDTRWRGAGDGDHAGPARFGADRAAAGRSTNVLDTLLGVVAEPGPRTRRRRRGRPLRVGAEKRRPLSSRPRQRLDRAVRQPHVTAIGAQLYRRDHRHRAPPRHRRFRLLGLSAARIVPRISEEIRVAEARTRADDDRLATELADLAARTRGQPARRRGCPGAAEDEGGGDRPLGAPGRALALTGDRTTDRSAGRRMTALDDAQRAGRGPDRRQHRPCTTAGAG